MVPSFYKELYNLLQDQQDRLLGSLRVQRRKIILQQLFTAKALPGLHKGVGLDPENYRLVIGERIRYNFTGQSCHAPPTDSVGSSDRDTKGRKVPLELWEYPESLRDGEVKPRPTFYFPEHNAGPDLVFALEPNNPKADKAKEGLWCVVQLKTAGSGVDVQKAITNKWSWNCESEKIRIVFRILIATRQKSVSPEDYRSCYVETASSQPTNWMTISSMFGKAPSQDHCRPGDQDRDAHVGDLFGPDFMSLLQRLEIQEHRGRNRRASDSTGSRGKE